MKAYSCTCPPAVIDEIKDPNFFEETMLMIRDAKTPPAADEGDIRPWIDVALAARKASKPAADEVEQIRARHGFIRAAFNSQPAIQAHADRLTLLRIVDTLRAENTEALALLREARCPNVFCKQGRSIHWDGDHGDCVWCARRAAIMGEGK
jgi:hypothetical protein